MKRFFSSGLVWAASLLLAHACASQDRAARTGNDSCGSDVGSSCRCDDGTNSGTYVCSAGSLECVCDASDDEDYSSDDDFSSSPSSSVRDAGRDARTLSSTVHDARVLSASDAAGFDDDDDASTGVTVHRDAGSSSAHGDSGSSVFPYPDPSSDYDAGGSSQIPGETQPSDPPISTGGGPQPNIPKASGACPEFRSGTATIGGLSGISLSVGPKKNGTGSLIFYWHGTGSSSAEAALMLPAGVRNEILAQGGIIVAPQGSTKKGADCSGTGTFSQGDFEVADLIAACAVSEYGIDPRRIYTTGCSAGGLQAGCMASRRSSYIAAAVPNSGGSVFPQPLQDKHVPAMMTMHGGSADMVIVAFSQTSATIDNQFKQAGGFVVNCNHGGGHCGAPAALQTAGWQFMKDHPFGVSPEPYASGLPSSFPSYCKVF